MKSEGEAGVQSGQAGRDESLRAGIARRWRWPSRLAVWAGAAATLFAFTCPAMLERGDRLTVAVTHAACMLRTFGLQCGVAALAACLLARLMGMKRLALVALLIAGVWLVPEAWKWKRSPAQGETGSEKLTVLSVNALFGRASVESIVRLAAACDADVVVVQEYTPRLEGALRPALSGYPYRVEMARDDGFGEAVFSRRPLVGESRVYPAAPMKWSSQPQIAVSVRLDGTVVRVTNIHLLSPVGLNVIAEQRREAVGLAAEVRALLSARDADGARAECVLAGDFNGTSDGHILAPVLDAGMVDSWRQGRGGRAGTWPAGTPVLSALGKVRLDNLLHSDGLVCVEAGVGEPIGSDHLPTWATYRRKR